MNAQLFTSASKESVIFQMCQGGSDLENIKQKEFCYLPSPLHFFDILDF